MRLDEMVERDGVDSLKTRRGALNRLETAIGPDGGPGVVGAVIQRESDSRWVAVAILGPSETWRALGFANAGVLVTNVQ